MLAYILAIAVGLGSFALYMAAFFFPEVHRKGDFIWSGIGLFYAVVLWFCAGRITGAVLLGQSASVALLGWFGWEMLRLRRELTPRTERTEISASSSSAFKLPSLSLPWQTKKDQSQTKSKTTPLASSVTAPPSTPPTPSPVETTSMPMDGAVSAASTEAPTVEREIPAAEPLPAYEDVAPAAAETAEILEPVAETLPVIPTPPPAESIAALDELEFDVEETPTPEPLAAESAIANKGTPLSPSTPPASTPPSRVAPKAQSTQKSTSGGFASLLAPVTGLVSDIKEGFSGLLSKGKKSKSQPDPKKSGTNAQKTATNKTVEKIATSEAVTAPNSDEMQEDLGKIAPQEPVTPETISAEIEADSNPAAVVSEAIAIPSIVESGPSDDAIADESTQNADTSDELVTEKSDFSSPPLTEIAPDAELAPPAEEEVIPTATYTSFDQLQPLDISESSIADSQPTTSEENVPELVRPNPPDPALVEAAQQAEETPSDSTETSSTNPENESKSKDLEA